MIKAGSIIYFPIFYFSNGNPPKSKFFITIGLLGNNTVLATLPTSKDHVPEYAETEHGCVELADAQFNCFVIKKGEPFTQSEWSFKKTTFIYGRNIGTYSIDVLKKKYPVEDVDFEVVGIIKKDIFKSLCNCLLESKWVHHKYKKLLQAQIDRS